MADVHITPARAAVFIPEIWQAGFLKGLYDAGQIRKRVLSADGDVNTKGDILHIRIAPQFSVNDVDATTGDVTFQALTPTESQLTVNQHLEVSFSFLDQTLKQADEYLVPCFEEGAPRALAQDIDTKILALASTLTSTPIDASAGLVADRLLEAFVTLAKAKVDMNDVNSMSWAFHWNSYAALKKEGNIGEYGITGKPNGGILEVKIPNVLGIPVYMSNLVYQTGGLDYNMLFHKEAFACGVQQNIKTEKLARVALRDDYVTSVLYGVKEIRKATHAVQVKTTTPV
jgi:hypothetical protein